MPLPRPFKSRAFVLAAALSACLHQDAFAAGSALNPDCALLHELAALPDRALGLIAPGAPDGAAEAFAAYAGRARAAATFRGSSPGSTAFVELVLAEQLREIERIAQAASAGERARVREIVEAPGLRTRAGVVADIQRQRGCADEGSDETEHRLAHPTAVDDGAVLPPRARRDPDRIARPVPAQALWSAPGGLGARPASHEAAHASVWATGMTLMAMGMGVGAVALDRRHQTRQRSLERRAHPRHACDLPCRLLVGGQAHGCRLVDVSLGGGRIGLAADAARGDPVALETPAGTFEAFVVWRGVHTTGLRFAEPLSEETLHRLLR